MDAPLQGAKAGRFVLCFVLFVLETDVLRVQDASLFGACASRRVIVYLVRFEWNVEQLQELCDLSQTLSRCLTCVSRFEI